MQSCAIDVTHRISLRLLQMEVILCEFMEEPPGISEKVICSDDDITLTEGAIWGGCICLEARDVIGFYH